MLLCIVSVAKTLFNLHLFNNILSLSYDLTCKIDQVIYIFITDGANAGYVDTNLFCE